MSWCSEYFYTVQFHGTKSYYALKGLQILMMWMTLPPPAFLIKCLSKLSTNNLQKKAYSGKAWRIKNFKR